MKKTFFALSLCLVFAGVFSGCSDDVTGEEQKASTGSKVNFAIDKTTSRTVYDDMDPYQINWVDGDKVRIYCAEAEDVKQADYNVTSIDQTDESKAKLEYSANGLAWGSDDLHNFYAVYPADDSKVSGVENGIVSLSVNQNQICTFPNEASSDGNYMGSPDMTNAYMVANMSTTPTDMVSLNFKPIMTTLQITLRGRENPNENQSFIAVTGLSIIRQVAETEREGYFQYDIKNGQMAAGSSVTPFTQTTFVGVSRTDAEGQQQAYIDLQPGESMTFTVFLPPFDINANNPIIIRPNVAGNAELTVTVEGQQTNNGPLVFNASSKGKLTLPVWPTEEVTGNNWITPLDNNIYVQQLSIPGAHDAAANSTSLLDVGVTQGLTIQEQFDLGIRAFDLRPAWRDYDGILGMGEFHGMWLYHGFTRTGISLDDALRFISGKLDDASGEFAILQLRHEVETGISDQKDPDRWVDDLYNSFTPYLNKIIAWRPDLTIGDCRGKMIVLTRDDYNNRSLAGLISDWPENTSGTASIATGDAVSTDYYVQDLYSYNLGDGSVKIEAFENLMATTMQFSSQNYLNSRPWAMNHISGYSTVIGIGGTQEYIWNAQQVALPIQRAIAGTPNPGPLGMVMMDFAGLRDASGWLGIGGSNQPTNCDLLTQTIIDNNYRYTMLRKRN